MGKNATFTSTANKWKFGVETIYKTGWIEPAESLNPLQSLFGEFTVGIPNKFVCYPVPQQVSKSYLNRLGDYRFLEQLSVYQGLTDTRRI